MLEVLFWILVGALIGWHIPEPSWAKTFKEKVLNWFKVN
jgi:hypothetical protein